MHNPKSFLPATMLLLAFQIFLFACHADSPNAEKSSAGYSEMESSAQDENAPLGQAAFQSSSATLSHWDSVKKLIRRAELSFRTPDVLQATLVIEDIVRANGGFVLENNLSQTKKQQYTTPLSKDSLLETTIFQVENRLVVRVPVAQLDTTIRAIGRLSEQLNYRNISAEDVGLKWLEEQLAAIRNSQYQSALQSDISNSPNKLQDVAQAREKALAGQAAADAARLEQLRIADAIQLSTITIVLSQRPVTKRAVRPRETPIAAWTPSFGAELKKSFLSGWTGLQNLFVLILAFWPLLLLGAVLFWWWIRKRKLLSAIKK